MQHRLVTGLFGGGSLKSSKGKRSGGGGGGGRALLALSLTCLAMVIITAAGLSAQLLLLAGDVELNPGPVSSQSLTDGLARLLASAPAEVREVLSVWDPVRDTVRAEIQKLTAPKLRAAIAWLYNTAEDSQEFKMKRFHNCKKETLSLVVMVGLERLLPDECGACNTEYTVEREETPVLQCKGCLQGFHAPCLPLGQLDMARVPGVLYWLCPRCKDCYVLKTEVGGGEGPQRPVERRRGKWVKPLPQAPPPADIVLEGRQPEREPPPLGQEDLVVEEAGGQPQPREQEAQPDCAAYLAGECAYGISGRRGEESCPLLHRKRCSTYMKWGDRGEKGCQKNPCDKIHPTVCQQSLDLECLNRDCQVRLHVQRCKRQALPRREAGEVRGTPPANRPRQTGRQGAGPRKPGRQGTGPIAGRSNQPGRQGQIQQGPGPRPVVWQHQQQTDFGNMTVQQMLEAYTVNMRRNMMERQADLARLVREELAMLRGTGWQLPPLQPSY